MAWPPARPGCVPSPAHTPYLGPGLLAHATLSAGRPPVMGSPAWAPAKRGGGRGAGLAGRARPRPAPRPGRPLGGARRAAPRRERIGRSEPPTGEGEAVPDKYGRCAGSRAGASSLPAPPPRAPRPASRAAPSRAPGAGSQSGRRARAGAPRTPSSAPPAAPTGPRGPHAPPPPRRGRPQNNPGARKGGRGRRGAVHGGGAWPGGGPRLHAVVGRDGIVVQGCTNKSRTAKGRN